MTACSRRLRTRFKRQTDMRTGRRDLARCPIEHIVPPPGKICPARPRIGRAVCLWQLHRPVAGFLNVEPVQNRTREAASIHKALAARKIPFYPGDIAVNLLSLPGYFEDFNTTFDKRTPRLARSVPAPADAQPDEGHFIENPQGKGGLLLYRDSFSGELMPFLSEDFAHMWS